MAAQGPNSPSTVVVDQATATGAGSEQEVVAVAESEDVGSSNGSDVVKPRDRVTIGRLTRTSSKSLFMDAAIVKTALRCCAEGKGRR